MTPLTHSVSRDRWPRNNSRRHTLRFRRGHTTDAEKLAIAEDYFAGRDIALIVDRYELTNVRSVDWIVRNLVIKAARHARRLAVAKRFGGT